MKLYVPIAAAAAVVSLAGCDASFLGSPTPELAAPEPVAETTQEEPAAPSLFEQRVSDLGDISSALEAFHADNGRYPSTDDVWISVVQRKSNNWLPELTPAYLPVVPRDPESTWDFETPQYVYISNGTGYKLIARKSGDCDEARATNAIALDPKRSTKEACWAYGYWTEDFAEK